MRVNMYSTPPDGSCGIGLYTGYLASELRKLNVDVNQTFIKPDKSNPIYYLRKAVKLTKNSDIIHLQFEYPFFGKFGPMTGLYIPLFYALLWIFNFGKARVITTMHDIWEVEKPPKFKKLGSIYVALLNRSVAKFSDMLIALSETAKNRLLEQGVKENKVCLVPHGTITPIFMDKRECKEKIGLNPDEKSVTIFGYIKESKGHDLLIKACKYLGNIRVVVAGGVKSSEDEEYLKKIKNMTNDKVIWYGYVEEDEIPLILNATDIMVLPHRKVTQSGVLNWALAYRIPTITSDLPYFREMNNKYSCVLLLENDDIKSLINAINTLLNDALLQNKLKEACKNYCDENTFKRASTEVVKVYKNLLNQRG